MLRHGARSLAFLGIALVSTASAAAEATTLLDKYLARADKSFAWTLHESTKTDFGQAHRLTLVSQTWNKSPWRHQLLIVEPRRIDHDDQVLLYIGGGTNGRGVSTSDISRFGQYARYCGGRVAVLFQVPNQPLLGGKHEDDLISETFLRHLKTRDPNWPLLFPMVKSAVRAMDAVQEVAQREWKTKVTRFVVTGASKRGWTTWLTSAVDRRVVGLAPMVIDTLNFPVQTRHQKKQWGKYSRQIADYTRKGLVRLIEQRPDLPLWKAVDPYHYRSRISQPKLIINGTNDPYWCVDALNNYWNDLAGPRYALYIPNAGHGLKGGHGQVVATLGLFFRSLAADRPLPRISWKHTDRPGGLQLTITSDPQPVSAQLWSARSETRDFRKSEFTATDMRRDGQKWVGEVTVRPGTHTVLYGHMLYQVGDVRYGFSTLVRVK